MANMFYIVVIVLLAMIYWRMGDKNDQLCYSVVGDYETFMELCVTYIIWFVFCCHSSLYFKGDYRLKGEKIKCII